MTDTPPARRRPAAPPTPKGLGRGLEALLGADLPVAASPGTPAPVASLAVERLQPPTRPAFYLSSTTFLGAEKVKNPHQSC